MSDLQYTLSAVPSLNGIAQAQIQVNAGRSQVQDEMGVTAVTLTPGGSVTFQDPGDGQGMGLFGNKRARLFLLDAGASCPIDLAPFAGAGGGGSPFPSGFGFFVPAVTSQIRVEPLAEGETDILVIGPVLLGGAGVSGVGTGRRLFDVVAFSATQGVTRFANIDTGAFPTLPDVEVPFVADGVQTLHDGIIQIVANTLAVAADIDVLVDGALAMTVNVAPGATGSFNLAPLAVLIPAGNHTLAWRITSGAPVNPANSITINGNVMYGVLPVVP